MPAKALIEFVTQEIADLKRLVDPTRAQKLEDAAWFMAYRYPDWASDNARPPGDLEDASDTDKEEFAEFALSLLEGGVEGSEELPWTTMDFRQFVRHGWLVHFSPDAADIWRNGFKYGVAPDDSHRLALSTNYKNRKKVPGYNFAFKAEDVRRYATDRRGEMKWRRSCHV